MLPILDIGEALIVGDSVVAEPHQSNATNT